MGFMRVWRVCNLLMGPLPPDLLLNRATPVLRQLGVTLRLLPPIACEMARFAAI